MAVRLPVISGRRVPPDNLLEGENLMTFNAKLYGALLADTVPGVIDSGAEYDRLEAVFNDLMNKGEDNFSPEEMRLFELLANLLEDYERKTLPPLEQSSPLDTLKFLMRENNLKQKDLVDDFGSQSVASAVLSGKRAISKGAAKKLGERFSVPADIFI